MRFTALMFLLFIAPALVAQHPLDLGAQVKKMHEQMEEAVRNAERAAQAQREAEARRAAEQSAQAAAAAVKAAEDAAKATIAGQLIAQAEARHQQIEQASGKALRALGVAECERYYTMTSKPGTPVKAVCKDMSKKRTDDVTRYYALQYNDFVKLVLVSGPELAKQITESCLTNMNRQKGSADAGGMLACLDMARSGNIVKMGEGAGSAREYLDLMKRANDAPQQAFHAPAASDDAATRQKVRALVTASCIEGADGYVQALCAGIAVHELFARDPYGDGGEIAKVLDKALGAYNVVNAPNDFIKQQTRNVLRQVGVPEVAVTLITNPAAVITNPGTVAQQAHDALPCIPSFFNNNRC